MACIDQDEYAELNLTDNDFAFEDSKNFINTSFSISNCSPKVAEYLTRKGSTVDSSIQWCSHISDKQLLDVPHNFTKKRFHNEEEGLDIVLKLSRPASMASFRMLGRLVTIM